MMTHDKARKDARNLLIWTAGRWASNEVVCEFFCGKASVDHASAIGCLSARTIVHVVVLAAIPIFLAFADKIRQPQEHHRSTVPPFDFYLASQIQHIAS